MPDLSEGRGVDRVGFIRLRAEELLAARGEMRAEWQLLDYEQRREWGSAAKATMPSLLVAVGLVPVRPGTSGSSPRSGCAAFRCRRRPCAR